MNGLEGLNQVLNMVSVPHADRGSANFIRQFYKTV